VRPHCGGLSFGQFGEAGEVAPDGGAGHLVVRVVRVPEAAQVGVQGGGSALADRDGGDAVFDELQGAFGAGPAEQVRGTVGGGFLAVDDGGRDDALVVEGLDGAGEVHLPGAFEVDGDGEVPGAVGGGGMLHVDLRFCNWDFRSGALS